MTRRSIAMPTRARDDEGERDGESERPVLQRGRQKRLHDVGRIGAEHHHFAMRHVDDAHDAEGDREADRRQQQNRGRRKPVPEVLRHAPQGEARVDRRRAPMRRRSSPPGRWPSAAISSMRLCASWSPRAFSVAIAARRSWVEAESLGGDDRRLGEPQGGGDARIAFLGELRLKRGQRLGVCGF